MEGRKEEGKGGERKRKEASKQAGGKEGEREGRSKGRKEEALQKKVG